jgi:transcription initiation factor TFIID subunit 8
VAVVVVEAVVAVSQLCEATGFHALQRSAVETLADIALRYLSDLGKAAHSYANLSGRTECNALDVVLAMDDLGLAGAAETSHCVSNSGALHDVMRYEEYAEEIPFTRPVPHFPVSKKWVPTPSFAQLGETPPHLHIPSWLPAFPDPRTYCQTPLWDERVIHAWRSLNRPNSARRLSDLLVLSTSSSQPKVHWPVMG